MNEFMVEDEKDKGETVRIYADLQEYSTAWQMANNNRKKIKETQKAVAGLAVLVMIILFIVVGLIGELIWRMI